VNSSIAGRFAARRFAIARCAILVAIELDRAGSVVDSAHTIASQFSLLADAPSVAVGQTTVERSGSASDRVSSLSSQIIDARTEAA
jgi:hypothetical protein